VAPTNGWLYKKNIAISDPGVDLTNYQVDINFSSSNLDFDKPQPDGDDIRFFTADGTSCDYWIEDWNYAGQTATVWVEIPEITTGSANNIYMYYGNSGASSLSSGAATFLFFDDFNDTDITDWTVVAGTWNATGGILNQTVNNGFDSILYQSYAFPASFVMESDIRMNSINAESVALQTFQNATRTLITGVGGWNNTRFFAGDDTIGTYDWDLTAGVASTWYDARMVFSGTHIDGYIDNNYLGTTGVDTTVTHNQIGFLINYQQDYASYDNIRVRQYNSTEPSTSVGKETITGINKPGAFGLGYDIVTGTAIASVEGVSLSSGAGAITEDNWHHVAMTYTSTGSVLTLYVDGVSSQTTTSTSTIPIKTTDFFIGDIIGPNCMIDEVVIYDRVLSSDEISHHANATNLSFSPAFGTIEFDDGGTNIIVQKSTSNFNDIDINEVAGSITLNTNIDVDGNVVITSGTLDTNINGNFDIDVEGDWSDSGTFIENFSIVTFDGDAAQTIGAETFYYLGITNSHLTEEVTLSGNVTATYLDINDGILAIDTGRTLNVTVNSSNALDVFNGGTLRIDGGSASMNGGSNAGITSYNGSVVELTSTGGSIYTQGALNTDAKIKMAGGSMSLNAGANESALHIYSNSNSSGTDITATSISWVPATRVAFLSIFKESKVMLRFSVTVTVPSFSPILMAPKLGSLVPVMIPFPEVPSPSMK